MSSRPEGWTADNEVEYMAYVRRKQQEYEKGYWEGTHRNWMTMASFPWLSRRDWLEQKNEQ